MNNAGNARSFRTRGRTIWLQLHRWIGLILFLFLIPVSASGSLLVWHDWTDSLVNPQRYSGQGEAVRPLSDYVGQARRVLAPNDRIATLAFPHEPGSPVVVTASAAPGNGGGPAARSQVWLNPADAGVLDRADMESGLIRILHRFHGSMMIPEHGRTIVGWLGVAMLVSSLTGLWLWLPVTGTLKRGFRWNRAPGLSGRLHHQFGFWIALPLAILSFTGAYISFPNAMRSVEGMFAGQQVRGGPGGPPGRSPPSADQRMTADAAFKAATDAAAGLSGYHPATLRWPTEKVAEWSLTLERDGARQEIIVADGTGQTRAGRPPSGAARFMRTLHDGTGYNPVWQTIIFVGGLLPALLGITGVLMWLRGRRLRRRMGEPLPIPAE